MNKILLCPDSVSFWAKEMISKKNRSIPIVSRSEFDKNNGVAELVNHHKDLKDIVIVSSHESFLNDIDLREQFESRGIRVNCQSSFACSLAVDKIKVKKILDENNIASINWYTEVCPEMTDFVVKKNDGSMGKGMKYYHKNANVELDNEFIETFVEGHEYSVNVFTDQSGKNIIFPCVYKGTTGRNMMHPSRRIRFCSKFKTCAEIINQMNDMAIKVGQLIKNIGFMEVEFIVNATGQVRVLEVNPRVSGTLRMASMACESMCFDLLLDEIEVKCNKQLECIRQALEIPYMGTPFIDKEKEIMCTTRASFCFYSFDEMISKIRTVKHMEEECFVNDAKNLVFEKL